MSNPQSTSTPSNEHVVLFSHHAWGHTRPLCVLAQKLVQGRPLYVSFFVPKKSVDQVEAELSRGFLSDESALRSLIRVIGLDPDYEGHVPITIVQRLSDAFARAYEQMVENSLIKCEHTGRIFEHIVAPKTVIFDFMCPSALDAVRKFSKQPVKALAWIASQATWYWLFTAPSHRGGRGDFYDKVLAEAARTGRPIPEVADELYTRVDGTLIHAPGIPPMYDYEFSPQQMPIRGLVGPFMMLVRRVFDGCDGVVISTAEAYELEAVAEIRAWFAESNKDVYVVGPLLPGATNPQALDGEQKQSQDAAEILTFMNKVLEEHGAKSLLYFSLGTVFWPATGPEKAWAVLDVIMQKNIPFIMSAASPMAIIPAEIDRKVKEYGKGILSRWTPQQTILSHPATGWFLTHAGQNSTLESICAGLPMICWPFNADQPTNAARLSSILNVAYELFEVRTGDEGLRPLHRTGKAPRGTIEAVREEASYVLDNAFGSDGQTKRANIEKLRDEVLGAWSEKGPARRDMEKLVAAL
ncbi:UDP-Glycosyltransferase/glycogen phosphorylase [Panus rudis PR-1116 ss-1]|nr:UDP-Glycosyltransferase/glycogen phosphorylase [Panus rudis PR-1116 ss-1]